MNSIFLFLGSMGGWEIFLIIMVVLILFGAKKIPELARGMGQGIREFKDATKEIKNNIDDGMQNPPANRPNAAPPVNPPRPMDNPAPTQTNSDNTPKA